MTGTAPASLRFATASELEYWLNEQTGWDNPPAIARLVRRTSPVHGDQVITIGSVDWRLAYGDRAWTATPVRQRLTFTTTAAFEDWLASVTVFHPDDIRDITRALREYGPPIRVANDRGRVLWVLDYDDGTFTATRPTT